MILSCLITKICNSYSQAKKCEIVKFRKQKSLNLNKIVFFSMQIDYVSLKTI